MTLEEIDTIAVLGAGTMGHGIAEVAAIAGYEVTLRDINEELVTDGYDQIEWSLDKLVEHQQLTEEAAEEAKARIDPVVPIADAVQTADFIIEVVPERMDIKRDVFSEVTEYASPDATFATNTSSLSITEIAEATDRPERCCGMHFFNPPVRMDLVEVIAGEETDEATLDLTERLARDMGKTPVRVNNDSPGFLVNRILIPMMNEAAWLVHEESASMAAVDATTRYELGLPMGAFELADQVGIDVAYHVLEYIHEQLGAAYEPCPLIAEKVEAEALGKKTDRGFYDYANGGATFPQDAADSELADQLLAVMANEVGKLLIESVADPDAIDTALELGAGFPDGPVTMADEAGLAHLVSTLLARHDETGAARYEPSEGLQQYAERGSFATEKATTEESFADIRLEYPAEQIGEIVIDRPHRMNTISPGILEELPQAVDTLEADDAVRVILITGEGDRAFSAGADLQGMASIWGAPQRAVALAKQGQSAFGKLMESELPVIAAIDGYCLGGGMELATAADLRIASDRSTFGQPERNLGLLPGWGGTQRLAPIVGVGRAKEIILTGEHYEAETMEQYGFVNRLVSASDFRERAVALAAQIAEGPPIAQGYAKQSMSVGSHSTKAGLAMEAQLFGQLTETDDLSEGISAFLEDRDPEFTGQ